MVKKQLSDEQIDALMRTLVNESAADEALLSEIADAPATWWGVQRKLNEQKDVAVSPWPPVNKFMRWLMAGVPVAAAAMLVLSFFVFRQAPVDDKGVVAVLPPASSATQPAPETVKTNEPISPITNATKAGDDSTVSELQSGKANSKQLVHKVAVRPSKLEQKSVFKTTVTKTPAKEEIKTEFIALSYARDPESGQIVRVKVPSSMMVSLGLVTSVKAPTDMVDAEVLVGDDGLSRAIRFIR